MRHQVFLVPGFFGFANLGEFFYFAHLGDLLEHLFNEAGVEVEVIRVPTHPTASIPVRTQRLADAIRTAGEGSGPIHIVGHSAGALDGRNLLAKDPTFEGAETFEPWASRVETLVSASTPHRGTPLATFFATKMGAPMLRAVSIATLHALRFGNVPISVVLKLASGLSRIDDVVGLDNTLYDQIFRDLLGDFSADRREAVSQFFKEVGSEQALVAQLTPDAMELFNAGASLRPGVRAGSIVTRARKPGLRTALEVGLNPYEQATHVLYRVLHGRTASRELSLDGLSDDHRRALLAAWPDLDPTASDGMVPTVSQPFGEVLATADGDHLDVIGHFGDPAHDPPHVDWVVTGSGFSRGDFERVWSIAVRWMLSES